MSDDDQAIQRAFVVYPKLRHFTDELAAIPEPRLAELLSTILEGWRDSVPRCATCKWWEEHKDYVGDGDYLPTGKGMCELAHNGDYPGKPSSLAIAERIDTFHDGSLMTDATFGCIQHEPKPLDKS